MIPINLIRQYIFCPRIPYYALLTNIKPIYPRHVTLGSNYHEVQSKLLKNRRFKKLNIDYQKLVSNLYLEDEELNICGEVDLAFITKEEVIPVEYKNIKVPKPSYGHKLQLIGYGKLLSKRYKKPFNKALVIYGKNLKFIQIIITKKLEEDFYKTIKDIENIIKNETLPNSSANESKCSQCEYLNYCDDRI